MDKKQNEYKKDIPFYKDLKSGPSYVKSREPISFREKISYKNQDDWNKIKPNGQSVPKHEDEVIKESIKKARQERIQKEKELISRRENYQPKGVPMTARVDPQPKNAFVDLRTKDKYGIPKEPAVVLDKAYPDDEEDDYDGDYYMNTSRKLPNEMVGPKSQRKDPALSKSGGKLDVADEIAIMMQRQGAGAVKVKVRHKWCFMYNH